MPRDVLVARPRAEEAKSAADVRDLVAARGAPVHLAPRRDPAHAPALERPLRGDGDGRGIRLQPLAGTRRHALARGRDARSVGQLPVPARRARAARSGRPATSRAAPRPTATRSSTPRTTPSSAAATVRSPPARASSSPPRTTPRSAGCRSRTSGRASREIELTSYAEIALAPQAADVAHPAFQNLFVRDRVRPRARRPPRDPPAAVARRAARSGRRTSSAVEDSAPRGDPVRDRPGPLPRPRPIGPDARSSILDGRPLSNTVGRGPRSDLQPPPPGPARARRDAARVASPRRRRVARGRRSISPTSTATPARLRARRDAGLDPGTGPAPSPRHRRRRGAPVPAARQPDPLLRPVAATAAGAAGRGTGAAPGAVGRTGSPATCPIVVVRHRRGRGPRHRPPAPAGPRVLAAEAACRRPGDPQRARRHLRPGPRRRAGGARADQPVAARPRRPSPRRAASTCSAATCSRPRTGRSAPGRRAGRRSLSRRGDPRRAGDPASTGRAAPCSRRRRAARRHAAQTRRGRRRAPPELEFFNGLGGFADDGREYVDRPRPGPGDARAVVNVIANPDVRVPGLRSRARATPGPATAARTSSRRGRTTPSAIPSARRSTFATTTPARSGVRPRRRSARTGRPTSPATGRGYSRFEHDHDGIGLDLLQFVPLDDRREDLAPDDREPLEPPPAAVGDRLRRVGPRHVPRRRGAHRSSPSVEPGDRRAARAQPLEHRVRGPRRRSWTSADGRRPGPPIAPSSSVATAAPDRPAGLDRDHRLQGRAGAGLDPCGALQTASSSRPAARTEVVVLLGEAADEAAAAELVRRGPAAGPRGGLARSTATGTTSPARSRSGRPTGRWTSWSTAGCSTRRSPAGCGAATGVLPGRRRVRVPRPAAGRHRAACRARSGDRARQHRRAPRPGSSSRATSSTGGIRRPVAACARASPTIACGCRTSCTATRDVTGDASILDEPVSVARGCGAPARPGRRLLPARRSRARRRRSTSTARAAIDVSLARRRARAAADGHRATGTTA